MTFYNISKLGISVVPVVGLYCEYVSKSIFNKSLSTGAFPLNWKTSDIIPIHKSGSKTVVETIEVCISIMSVFSKILDSIVSDVITNTVENRTTLKNSQ
jgi:hypothetical protein